MTKPKVVVAEAIAPAGIATLAETCVVDEAAGVDRAGLLARLTDAAGLVVRSATQVDAELIGAAPRLQVVGRAGIGVDNIDLDAATRAGILVVNAPNANTISAAEHTMALLLGQARRVAEADASLRGGSWERKRLQGVELHGKTLGIAGLGRIGTLVAQRASAFGMQIIAFDPYVAAERARRIGVELVAFEELLARSDFVTIHLPLTRRTEHLFDAAAFSAMKPGARVINVARGGVVDEDALAAAVGSGHLGGAAVDVFADEPVTASPLFALPQVVVTPHLGASTREAQDKAGADVALAVVEALRGELVLSAVNVDLGPSVSDEIRPFLPFAEQLGRIFVAQAKGVPDALVVTARGRLADHPIRPLALAALKGLLAAISDEPVSYVNAPLLAESRGITVVERAEHESADYQSVVSLRGTVDGTDRHVAGTVMERKGPVLVNVDGYEIELPLHPHMLLVRNEDVPGVIGRVGTYLGDLGVNIADMVVGRDPHGAAAMMGMALDAPLDEARVAEILALHGVAAVRYIDL